MRKLILLFLDLFIRWLSVVIISCLKLINFSFILGIQAHRSAVKLMSALEHMERMESSRMDDLEYTYHRLRHLLVEKKRYRFEDFERVLEEFRKTHGL